MRWPNYMCSTDLLLCNYSTLSSRGRDTLVKFCVIVYIVNMYCDLCFSFMHTSPLQKKDLPAEANSSRFRLDLFPEGNIRSKLVPLEVCPFSEGNQGQS